MKARRMLSAAKKLRAKKKKIDTLIESVKRAIKRGDLEFVSKRMDDGLDLHQEDGVFNWRGTKVVHKLIHTAAYWGTREMLDLLVKSGCGLETPAKYSGCTPLHMAVLGRNVEAVEYFLDHHANVNAVDADGHKAICVARLIRAKEIRKLLEPLSSPCEKHFSGDVDIIN